MSESMLLAVHPITRLIREAAMITGIPISDIKGPCKAIKFARVRQCVSLVARDKGFTYRQIGDRLGKDHKAIVFHCDRARHFYSTDPFVTNLVNRLGEVV